jgi:hypothetical protein
MDFKTFILVYFVIVFSGSLAVTGWYFITRGDKKILEDGSEKRVGKVFRNWYFYWTKIRGMKKIYFDEPHLFELFLKIRDKFMVSKGVYEIKQTERKFWITNWENYSEEMRWIENAFEVKFKHTGGGQFVVYKEYEDFVFPYWVRDPLAQCATCFSSIYGSIFYWLLIALPKQSLFNWASIPWLAAVCFWIAFCFSLSVINTALAKRFN